MIIGLNSDQRRFARGQGLDFMRPAGVKTLWIQTDELHEVSVMPLLCTGLELIWRNRLSKKITGLFETRAELECLVITHRKSRPKGLKEASSIIENTQTNFPFN